MNNIKVMPKETHSYGQSAYTLNRPMTLQDAMPVCKLDPSKTYRIENGVFVEVK